MNYNDNYIVSVWSGTLYLLYNLINLIIQSLILNFYLRQSFNLCSLVIISSSFHSVTPCVSFSVIKKKFMLPFSFFITFISLVILLILHFISANQSNLSTQIGILSALAIIMLISQACNIVIGYFTVKFMNDYNDFSFQNNQKFNSQYIQGGLILNIIGFILYCVIFMKYFALTLSRKNLISGVMNIT